MQFAISERDDYQPTHLYEKTITLCLPLRKASFRYILHAKKTAFVVEHDFIMGTYLADRVIMFEGTPSKSATANT